MHDCIRCSHLSGELLLILAPAPGPVPFRNGVLIYIYMDIYNTRVMSPSFGRVEHVFNTCSALGGWTGGCGAFGMGACILQRKSVCKARAGRTRQNQQPTFQSTLSFSTLLYIYFVFRAPVAAFIFSHPSPFCCATCALFDFNYYKWFRHVFVCSFGFSGSLAPRGLWIPILHSFKAISWRSYTPQPSKALDFHWLCTSAFFRCLFQLLQLARTATNLGCTASSSLINYLEATCLLLCWKSQTLSLWPLR